MDGVDGGCPPHTCTCTRMHACTHACVKHDNFMQMAAPIWESLGIPYDVICACACMCVHACVCVCMCVGGTLSPPPPPSTHPFTPRGTPRITQNSIALELIEIFQFRLKIWNLWRLPHPWVGVWLGGWVGGWVGWWVGSGQNSKNCWLNQDNSILFEDLWFVETPPPMGGCVGIWVGQWVNGWS